MKGKIEKIEDAKTSGGKPYVKVWFEGRKNFTPVWDSMKDKWGLLFEGAEVEFKFHKDGDKFILDDIIGIDTKETVQPTPAMPQQRTEASPSYLQESTQAAAKAEKDAAMAASYAKDLMCANVPIPLSLRARALCWMSEHLNTDKAQQTLMEDWLNKQVKK